MLKIKFFRTGKKGQPFYRIRVANKKNPPASGRFADDVGFYNPSTKECKIDKNKAVEWIEKGVELSDTVKNLFIKKGIIIGKKVSKVSLTKKRREKIKQEEDKQKEKESIENESEMKETVDKVVETAEEVAVENNKEAETKEKQEEAKQEKTEESKKDTEKEAKEEKGIEKEQDDDKKE